MCHVPSPISEINAHMLGSICWSTSHVISPHSVDFSRQGRLGLLHSQVIFSQEIKNKKTAVNKSIFLYAKHFVELEGISVH